MSRTAATIDKEEIAMSLNEESVLILSGSSGIGLGVAEAPLQEGATITIVGRTQEKLRAARESLGLGDRFKAIPADVTNEDIVVPVTLRINGRTDQLELDPRATLLGTPRERLPPAIACVARCLGAPALAQRLQSSPVVSGALFLVAAGLVLLASAPATFGLAAIILGMMMLGLGVSTVVTLGTDLVLTAAPPEKAGAASAISETGADIGGSFGVAILGSIGVAIYQRSLALPAGIDLAETAAARDTLGAAVDVAEKLPGSLGASLIGSAHDAFTLGLQIASSAGAVIPFAMAIFFAWTSFRPFKSAQVQLTQGEMA